MSLGASFSVASITLGDFRRRKRKVYISFSEHCLGLAYLSFITHHSGVTGSFLLSLMNSTNPAVRLISHP